MFKSVVKVCGSTVKLQLILDILSAVEAVSYTHLDVYKRQIQYTVSFTRQVSAVLDWQPKAPYTAEQLLEILRILRRCV